MKRITFILVCLISLVSFGSCSNDDQILDNEENSFNLTKQEQAKYDEIKRLFEGIAVVNPTEDELRKLLTISMDTLLAVRELFQSLDTLTLTTCISNELVDNISRGLVKNEQSGKSWICTIEGHHSGAVCSSRTIMDINYQYPAFAKILRAGVKSEPDVKFEIDIPNVVYNFGSRDYIDNLRVNAHCNYLGIAPLSFVMIGMIHVHTGTGIVTYGEITAFHQS